MLGEVREAANDAPEGKEANMKEMTTAEFAKANLAALEEPVTVRRYTKTVGTYYPEGYEPKMAVAVPSFPTLDLEPQVVAQAAQIVVLEDEVKRLKKLLAAREPTQVITGAEYMAQERRTVPQHPMKDAFSDLAKQDREFFERKLGKTTKSK
jgi:hypothetical protein